MRSWLVAVGVAAALLAAIGVFLILGRSDRAPPPAAVAARPATATPTPAPTPAATPAPAPTATPAPAPTATPAPAPGPRAGSSAAERRAAARDQALAERTAAKELAAAAARQRAEAERARAAELAAAAAKLAPPPPAPAPGAEPDRALPPELTGAISGRLLDERGQPLGETPVLAVATDGGDGQETFTDDDGSFLVAGLRPGRYVVFSGLGSALASRLGARGVSVAAAQVARLEVRERHRGGTVRVSAVDPDGRPAHGEAILVSGAPGAGGSFGPLLGHDLIWLPGLGAERMSFEKVPPGTYTLVLLLDGATATPRAAQEPVVVTEGDVAVNVRLGREQG